MLKFEQEKYLFELGFEVRYHHSYQFLSVRILVNKWNPDPDPSLRTNYDPDAFQIEVARRNGVAYSMLCEKGKCLSTFLFIATR